MMEELKLVLDSIGDLTGVALWVVGFFIVFKLVVYLSTVGVIYKLVKLFIDKFHNYLVTSKPAVTLSLDDATPSLNDATPDLDRLSISCELNGLLKSLRRVTQVEGLYKSSYLHKNHVQWLDEAISEKIAKEAAKNVSDS